MDNTTDIRWKQRFQNYCKALDKLRVAVKMVRKPDSLGEELDEMMKEALVQRFEYTHELAWKVMKDYAEYQGIFDIRGSRDALRRALQMELISDSRWMETIEARNLTSHRYDEEMAQEICDSIIDVYYPLFEAFMQRMKTIDSN